MYEGSRIAVVVPAFNEARHIATVIETMPAFVDHIIVVDDASTDETAAIAEMVGDSRVEVLRNSRNLGVGGTVLNGHRRALEIDADIAVVMAGDAQMDPVHLCDLLVPVTTGNFGFSKANRFYSASSFSGMPRHRIIGNIALSFLTKVASGYWHLFDPQNGYTAIRCEVLRRLDLDAIACGYPFENDLLIQLGVLRVPACDVPIPARYGEETSNLRPTRVGFQILGVLMKGFWRRMVWRNLVWSFSPVALLFFSGLLLLVIATLTGAWVIANTVGPAVATSGTVVMAVGPLLLGALLLVLALVLDIGESPGR